MKKYRLLLSIAFQDAVQYRLEGAIWFLFDALPPLMMVFVWLAAYRETEAVGGYDLGQMLGYYFGLALLRNAITSHPEWDIAESIRDGKLSMLLLRPLSPWGFWLVADGAWRLFRIVLTGPLVLCGFLLLQGQLAPPRLDPQRLAALALALPLAYALCFFLKISLGFSGFWLLDINGVVGFSEVAIYLFGGTIVPLELLPGPIQALADLLPLKYLYFYPLSLALGRLEGPAVWSGLALQAAWTGLFYLLARTLWLRGLRRYEAVGA